MGLTEELASVNLTKSELAERLGVSRKTIQRMGEEVTPEVRQVLNSVKEPEYKWLKVTMEQLKSFDGKGRGVPVGGLVLIARGGEIEDSVVSEVDWKARLDYTCKHGREGWSCKECLK